MKKNKREAWIRFVVGEYKFASIRHAHRKSKELRIPMEHIYPGFYGYSDD